MAMDKRRGDPLGSTGSNNSMYSSDEEDFGISFTTLETKCEQLFERGLELKVSGEIEHSVSCFLDCLKGMQESQYFAKLPQTLHHLGELHNSLGHHEDALEFAQAEKLFYEAVLVNKENEKPKNSLKRPKRKLFSKNRTKTPGQNPAEYGELLIKKAMEYEMLGQLCASERKFELAVDYSGKAVQLKRYVYGPEHPETIASLDSFSVLYAELGRQEYTAVVEAARGPIDNGIVEDSACIAQDVAPVPEHCEPAELRLQQPLIKDTPIPEYQHTAKEETVTNLQVECTVLSTQSKCSNNIHWSPGPSNEIHGPGDCLEVCAEMHVEHNRFCPLWVLLLGALLEMGLVAYVVYLR